MMEGDVSFPLFMTESGMAGFHPIAPIGALEADT